LALNSSQISTAGFRLGAKPLDPRSNKPSKIFCRWTLHEAVGKAEDAQIARLWPTAKNVAFGP
jgi:hypothetical protein